MGRSEGQAHYPLEILNDIAMALFEPLLREVVHVLPGRSQPQVQLARLQIPAEEGVSSAAVSPKLVFSITFVIPCFIIQSLVYPANE